VLEIQPFHYSGQVWVFCGPPAAGVAGEFGVVRVEKLIQLKLVKPYIHES